MLHFCAHTVRPHPLFHTWSEGLELWRALLRAVPHPQALCLMPDHIHLVADAVPRRRIGAVLSGWARRRAAPDGRLFRRVDPPTRITPSHVRRTLRYVHLNPCRAQLVDDPLAWPLSTHRDAIGLTAHRVGPRRNQRFHRYVASDEHVPRGSPMPIAPARPDLQDLLFAACALYRCTRSELGRQVHARGALLSAGRAAGHGPAALAAPLGVTDRTLRRTPARPDPRLALLAGDPRFRVIGSEPTTHAHMMEYSGPLPPSGGTQVMTW